MYPTNNPLVARITKFVILENSTQVKPLHCMSYGLFRGLHWCRHGQTHRIDVKTCVARSDVMKSTKWGMCCSTFTPKTSKHPPSRILSLTRCQSSGCRNLATIFTVSSLRWLFVSLSSPATAAATHVKQTIHSKSVFSIHWTLNSLHADFDENPISSYFILR